MKNLLWFQNPDNKGDDFLYVNSRSITPPNNPLYIENFRFLLNTDKKAKYKSSNKTLLYKLTDGYLLKDYFENKDIIGRNMTFLFYSNTTNIEEFIERLKQETNLLELCYAPSKIEEIRTIVKRTKTNIMIGLAIAVIVSILLIYKLLS